jgi:hypothetical protein
VTRLAATFVLASLGIAQGASGEGACSPLTQPDVDDTDAEVTIEAGRLEDEDVSLDWRLYGAWENGACLDLKFTNLGKRIIDWRFDITFDKVVDSVAYGGPQPASFSVVLDQARLVPFSDPQVQPFGSISYPVCFEPIVRPDRFVATVTRDADDGGAGEDAVTVDDRYGFVFDDDRRLMLSWLAEAQDDGTVCLDLRLSNLAADERILGWAARVQFDAPFTLASVDTSFFYFPANLQELDILPTEANVEIDPLDIATGVICVAPYALPLSLDATYATEPATPSPIPAERIGRSQIGSVGLGEQQP